MDEAKGLHSGKFAGEVARGDEGGEFAADDFFAGGVNAAGAPEAVNGKVDPALHLVGNPVGETLEAELGFVVIVAAELERAGPGKGDAKKKHRSDQKHRRAAIGAGRSGLHGCAVART